VIELTHSTRTRNLMCVVDLPQMGHNNVLKGCVSQADAEARRLEELRRKEERRLMEEEEAAGIVKVPFLLNVTCLQPQTLLVFHGYLMASLGRV
jgi:hypothetical protein